MTAINKNGQVYWTFEELDFDGAIEDIKIEIKMLDLFIETSESTQETISYYKRRLNRLQIIGKLIELKYAG